MGLGMSKLRLSTTLAGVLFCIALGAQTAVGEVPRGVFSLFGAGQFSNDSVLANPDIAGVSIRQDWAQLEPTEGNFDFTFRCGDRAGLGGREADSAANQHANRETGLGDGGGREGGRPVLYLR